MPPSASIAPVSHHSYASPTSRRVKAVIKAPATPSNSSTLPALPPSPAITHTASHSHGGRRQPKASPPSTPREVRATADTNSHSRSTSHSTSAHTPPLPRFHMADFSDSSPSASPRASPPASPRDKWNKPTSATATSGALLSPKPPSPPLNHTNTFYRSPTPHLSTPPVPPPLLSPSSGSPAAGLVSRRSLNQSMAVMTAEMSGREGRTVIVTKNGSSVAVNTPPSPPPPSPSSSARSTHHVPSLGKVSSMPAHFLNSSPLLPSPSHQARTVSSPVIVNSLPTASPQLSGPPALSPSSSALALLHASYVFVKTSSSLLSRWQKRWLMLTQHRATPYYRLTLYAQPGQSDPLDTLHITTTSTVTAYSDKRKQCRLSINSDNKQLVIDCVDAAEKTTWNLALQQAALLTHHSASALSPTAMRALSFPPPSSSATGSALTSWEQYFFHLYYSLPEVGYVHAHYDAAIAKFKQRFVDEEAIVRYLLDTVKEEVRRERTSDGGVPHEDGAVYVNESAITAYLSAKFGTTSLPTQLLNHALASTTTSTPQPLLHPVPFTHSSTAPPPVVIDPINQAQLLTVPNPTVPISPSAGPHKQRFEQRLHSPATLHHLSTLLMSSSVALSSLAFRLLWLIVGNVYPPSLTSNVVQLYLSLLTPRARGSGEMIASMRCLLFAQSVAQDTVGLRSSYLRPFVLPCLLSSLALSSFSLRESTLKDLSACLLQQSNNIMALASLPHWQTLLLALLTDVHYDVVKDIGGVDRRESTTDGEEIESVTVGGESVGRIVWHEDVTMRADYQQQRSVYSYVHNMFAIVHYRAFITVPAAPSPSPPSPLSFTTLLCSTLDSLFTFAGPRITTQRTAFLMLSTLLNLIDANVAKRTVLHSSDTRSADWRNLSALLAILRAYTFQCHHWIATDSDTHTYHTAHSNIRMVLYQCKFRHPSFTPFHSLLDCKPATLDTVGVHFDEEGAAADLPLVKRVLRILEAVRVDSPPDAAVQSRGSADDDRVHLLSLYHYYVFYESSHDFLAGLQERLQMDDTINIRKLREAVVAFMEAEEAKVKRDREASSRRSISLKKDSPRGSVVSDERISHLRVEMSRTVMAPRDSPASYATTPTSKPMSVTRRDEQDDRYRTPAGVRRQLHSELAKEKSTTTTTTINSHVSLPHNTPPTPDSPTHITASANTTNQSTADHKRGSSDSLLLQTELYSKLSQRTDVQLALECSEEETVGGARRQGSYVSTEKLDSDEDRSLNEEGEERSGSRQNKDSWSLNGTMRGEVDGIQVGPPATP